MSNVSGVVLVGLVARTLLLWQILLQKWAATDWAFLPFVKGNGATCYATPTLRNRLSLSGWRSRDQRCKLSKVLGDGARTNSSRSLVSPGPLGYQIGWRDKLRDDVAGGVPGYPRGLPDTPSPRGWRSSDRDPCAVLTYDRVLLVGIGRNQARIGLGMNEATTLARMVSHGPFDLQLRILLL